MLLITTLSYDEFGAFVKNSQVTLNNADLILGQNSEVIGKYIRDRLGSRGYVMGLRGRINKDSAEILSGLDSGLEGDRFIIEVDVDDDDVLSFDVAGLEEAVQIMEYGLPDEMVYAQLDSSLLEKPATDRVTVLCAPQIRKGKEVRITSLSRNAIVNIEGITFVKLG